MMVVPLEPSNDVQIVKESEGGCKAQYFSQYLSGKPILSE